MAEKKGKVLPIGHTVTTRERLMEAVGDVLAEKGFMRISEDMVAERAKVHRRFLFRYFGGLEGLIKAYSQSTAFWPSAAELIQGEEKKLRNLTSEEQVAAFFKRYLTALRKRPLTLEILAWESLQRNRLTVIMEDVRVRSALEFFELLHEDIPDDIDLSAIVLLLAAAVNYLAIRSRTNKTLGGIDLRSEEGWTRIEKAIDVLLKGTLAKTKEMKNL